MRLREKTRHVFPLRDDFFGGAVVAIDSREPLTDADEQAISDALVKALNVLRENGKFVVRIQVAPPTQILDEIDWPLVAERVREQAA